MNDTPESARRVARMAREMAVELVLLAEAIEAEWMKSSTQKSPEFHGAANK